MTGPSRSQIDTEISVAATRAAVQAALVDAASVNLSQIIPPPTSYGWTLAPDALRFLVAVIQHLKPRHIVEFGSGLSTRVIAWTCARKAPQCRISSIDHDPEYSRKAADELETQEIKASVRFLVAPLVVRTFTHSTLPLYYLEKKHLASQRPADLLVVDGPPISLGGRLGTLYQAMKFARPGTLFLLDDASRSSEMAAIAHWQKIFGQAFMVEHLSGFSKGLAAVIIRQPVPMAEVEVHAARLMAEELAAVVPADATFMFVGEDIGPDQAAISRRRAVPFLEKGGCYWGTPADDDAAIKELERLRDSGKDFIVFPWQAFWWLDFYEGFHHYLRARFPCVLNSSRQVVFDLRE